MTQCALQPGCQCIEWVGLTLEECSKRVLGTLTDTLDGGHGQFGLAVREVVIKATLGRIGGSQQFVQTNAMQTLALQGIDHGVDQFVASSLGHGLDYVDRSV